MIDRVRRGAVIAAGLVLLHVVLTLPHRADWIEPASFVAMPVELPVLLGILLVLGAVGRWWLARLAGGLVAVVLALKLADIAAHAALARHFNPVLDLHLAVSSWHLASGAIGPLATAALGAVALGGIVGSGLLVALGLVELGRVLPAVRWRSSGALGMGAVLVLLPATEPRLSLLAADTSRLVRDHAIYLGGTLADLRELRETVGDDPFARVPNERLLAGLAGRDVLLLFVESYGRSALEHPRYAPTIEATLERFESSLRREGFHARSGWLTAPIVGGQSWLAHASMLSGLWIDSQRRYQSLLVTERRTLVHDFARAGWRTVAVMPAITMAWPEAEFFAYDAVHAAAELGYRGAPFNWVTMPDQYTLTALERLELQVHPRLPVLAEVALISSHAPWTPIPPVLPWDDVGDGSVFTPYALSGDPPAVVWRDSDRVRDQYLLAVDYALRNLESYLVQHGDDDRVIIILGDHQPAPLVTGPDATFDVPVHVISRDPSVIAAIEGWGWAAGMRPSPDLAAWRMDRFRERFLEAFTPVATGVARAALPEAAGRGSSSR